MRTRQQIDHEYSHYAKIYGDRVFKGAQLQEEIKKLHERMVVLSFEQASDEAPINPPLPVVPPEEKSEKPEEFEELKPASGAI